MIGVDGCVDFIDDRGLGIIHTAEPCQAVFFAINAVTNNARHANKYSPASGMLQRKQEIGQEAHEMTKQVVADLKTLKTPQEVLNYLMDNKRIDYIKLVKDQDAREYVLSKYPRAIMFLPRSTHHEQLAAITADPAVIDFIEKPDQLAVTFGLRNHPEASFNGYRLASIFPAAIKELQLRIVRTSPGAADQFIKTYPEVLEYLIGRILSMQNQFHRLLSGLQLRQASIMMR